MRARARFVYTRGVDRLSSPLILPLSQSLDTSLLWPRSYNALLECAGMGLSKVNLGMYPTKDSGAADIRACQTLPFPKKWFSVTSHTGTTFISRIRCGVEQSSMFIFHCLCFRRWRRENGLRFRLGGRCWCRVRILYLCIFCG
jgi:hypothetical protein